MPANAAMKYRNAKAACVEYPLDQITMKAFAAMDRDWYQIDAMTKGAFPEYKRKIYRDTGVDLKISEDDKKAFEEGKIDFIGINYYASAVETALDIEGKGSFFGGLDNPYLKQSD